MSPIEPPVTPRIDEALVISALSDEYARRILSACIKKARSAREIEQETGMPQATVYRHVHTLVQKGLLAVERSALTEEGKRVELYRSRVRRARVELDAAGVRLFWEPVEEVEERLIRIWNTMREV